MQSIAIFASGAGSNARQIIQHFKHHAQIKVSLIVCNKPGAGVITIAEQEEIPLLLINREEFFHGDAYVPLLQKKPHQLYNTGRLSLENTAGTN